MNKTVVHQLSIIFLSSFPTLVMFQTCVTLFWGVFKKSWTLIMINDFNIMKLNWGLELKALLRNRLTFKLSLT